MTKLIGVDIGGTFTDIGVLDQNRQSLEIAKVSSTPQDPARGMVDGLDDLQICGDQIDLLVHGTTVATNAVLERKGGCCGLLTTQGFRDVLELRRRNRPHLLRPYRHLRTPATPLPPPRSLRAH